MIFRREDSNDTDNGDDKDEESDCDDKRSDMGENGLLNDKRRTWRVIRMDMSMIGLSEMIYFG